MKIAVILARGGSKRIPRKNIRDFCGKPMIFRPIQVAKASKLFEHILVSTDDPEITTVSKKLGVEVPFIRPPEISDDYAGTTEVMAHAVSWMHAQGLRPKLVCCLYATSVFLTTEDLIKGANVLEKERWKYVFSATSFGYPILRSFRIHHDGGVEMYFPENSLARSQDLPEALHDAAQFYWGTPLAWLEKAKIFERHSYPVVLPHWRVQDVDTEHDWKRAEHLYQSLGLEL